MSSSSKHNAQLAKHLYERMLLTRLVDEYICQLYAATSATTFVSCRGYEAAQIGSAACIQLGQDFTLPHYRDLGVMIAIGMSPYEVFCTHLQNQQEESQDARQGQVAWSYAKHNTVTGSTPVATQILHAAGIAFASKLRKVPVVTIAYCGDDIVTESDFLEGIRFATLHSLPIIFICEHSCGSTSTNATSCIAADVLPDTLAHYTLEGTDVLHVHQTMQDAIQYARSGQGPVLLEVFVSPISFPQQNAIEEIQDPLVQCKQQLQLTGEWDEEWATGLHQRLLTEIEQAMHDALRDTHRSKS